jgi:hypothetical protein
VAERQLPKLNVAGSIPVSRSNQVRPPSQTWLPSGWSGTRSKTAPSSREQLPRRQTDPGLMPTPSVSPGRSAAAADLTHLREHANPGRPRTLIKFAVGGDVRRRGGGQTGIRTLDTLRYTRFPSVRLQPLGHLSTAQLNLLNLTQSRPLAGPKTGPHLLLSSALGLPPARNTFHT